MGWSVAGEESGSNKDKGNGWPQTDDVDNGKWLATIDVEGTTTEEDISRGGKGKVTWVARGGTSGTTVQPRLSELAGTGKKRSDNRGFG